MARKPRTEPEIRANRQRARTIRRKNDAYRKDLINARVLISRHVRSLEEPELRALLLAVRDYRNFSPIYDPCREHDRGGITLNAQLYFWHIDYSHPDQPNLSPDPTDDATCRMITIMHADEA